MSSDIPITTEHKVLFISDPAWKELIRIAVERGYFTQKEGEDYKVRGMHTLIRDLMSQRKLFDTRPDYIKETDNEHREQRYATDWQRFRPRRKRTVKVTNDTLIQACAHAHVLGISAPPDEHILGAPDFFEGTKNLSILLEAFGTGWLADHEHE